MDNINLRVQRFTLGVDIHPQLQALYGNVWVSNTSYPPLEVATNLAEERERGDGGSWQRNLRSTKFTV